MIEMSSSHARGKPHPTPGAAGEPPATEAHTLPYGVIGSGRVGSALAAALAAAGHRLVATSSDLLPYARTAIASVPAGTGLPAVRLTADRIPPAIELLLVCVPDDALAIVAGRLAAAVRPGVVVAHTSGAHGLAVLEPVRAAGAVPLALHPAMTFTGAASDLDRLTVGGVAFGVTSTAASRRLAERLIADLGGVPEWVAEEDRTMYHSALAHGANHLVTLVNEASDLLRAAGVDDPSAVLTPLLTAALDNALGRGDAALTGPVSRGDAGTVAAHLAVLSRRAPESVPPYVALARRTIDRAITAGGLPAARAVEVLETLEGFLVGTSRASSARSAAVPPRRAGMEEVR